MAEAIPGHLAAIGCLSGGNSISSTEGELAAQMQRAPPSIFLSSLSSTFSHFFPCRIFFVSDAKMRLPPFPFTLHSSCRDPFILGPGWGPV